MLELNNQEMYNVEGGGWGLIAGIGAGIIFLLGLIDGQIKLK